ncbi:MAG: hypothetical protein IJ301_03065 [Clostridia bacterium]|nr:hypothetical protein [Clostridia bacterium]
MLKELLKYQKMDSKLVQIEHELENSDSKRVVNQMVEQVKTAQNKLVSLERYASELIAEYERLKQQFADERERINDAKSTDYKRMGEADLRDNATSITKQIGDMLMLNKEITALSKKILKALNDFEHTKQVGVNAKKKYSESIDRYNQFAGDKTQYIEGVKSELKTLERDIDPEILKKYKKMREDHKFPVLVPLVNNSCGVCAMEVPKARLDILAKDRILECENCHRMIYLKEDDI